MDIMLAEIDKPTELADKDFFASQNSLLLICLPARASRR